jgi:Rod binding domain-containing protein
LSQMPPLISPLHTQPSELIRPDLNGLAKTDPRDTAQAVKAAKDFESIFLQQVLQEMKKTIPDSGLTSDGVSGQIKDIFWYYLAQEMGEQGGLGLWKEVYRQMTSGASAGAASMEQSL